LKEIEMADIFTNWVNRTPTAELKRFKELSDYKTLYTVRERKKITFAINSREGKHKYGSPAHRRAQLLGQLQYLLMGAQGLIGTAYSTLHRATDTDMSKERINNLRYEIAARRRYLDDLVYKIRELSKDCALVNDNKE
jgi:hypothetical protein